ncbi:aminopeptidase N [Xinfangfangia sp. D13-10-4-6]|uniref:aminopeptidase N n=1 Tax=Pseudogemmobacter hezensis TaxID=2737662 RepID=UPI001556FB76|nr:aminopeptidase N [Pseudogemmobacter hezensis]NPD15863.1 aminopeptidase N [Pseudogemmobacter hezensis]
MTATTPSEHDPRTVWLSDYRPFSHLVDRVELTFRLSPLRTKVAARLHMRPNPAAPGPHVLRLDGEELRLISLKLDGALLDLTPDETGLTIPGDLLPDAPFTLETLVEIDPAENTALEGLYMSNGMYCTQCEAQGFRKITFYPDRPDVMARFSVVIEGEAPVLLSNGNPVAGTAGADGQTRAEWDDPWPKPAYLFALVAGDLVAHRDRFTTKSGRDVDLAIWVRQGDQDRCAWAMDSLIRSMKWDEEVYGREYDLDIFNIVAVDDFNMGAMENKGLNIFNSKFVLASPETATDDDFARIEAIIAHEYFHNWTGNRITCRDWFQLCLKEGLTVFRDQQFSGDMRSHAVKRIEDVALLRARQFREDQGPLAHPVRPESFVEINNFYTATVYEKGAELIRMLKVLVGDQAYAKALDLYFSRHDGHAATIEDWLRVFEDVTGQDLSQFKRWYSEAGTPRLQVSDSFENGTYRLVLRQHTPPTPGQPVKSPKVIPVAVGLLAQDGSELHPTRILTLTEAEQSFEFTGLNERPVPSILRGFSAPVVLERETSVTERALLLAHDSDLFNRYEAGRSLAREMLVASLSGRPDLQEAWLDALVPVIRDVDLDPAFRALILRLPGEDDLAQALADRGITPDPAAIYLARRSAGDALAAALARDLPGLLAGLQDNRPFVPDAAGAGRRALHAALLALQSRLDGGQAAAAAFAAADNMSATIAALTALLDNGQGQAELTAFAGKWQADRNVMDKWFMLQIACAAPGKAAEIADALTGNADFDLKNPNRFRAVFGALAANHAGFHQADGACYRLLADWLLRLDTLNPQTAARISTAFETWPRYDAARQALIRAELTRISATPGLSRDLSEMVGRMLAAG